MAKKDSINSPLPRRQVLRMGGAGILVAGTGPLLARQSSAISTAAVTNAIQVNVLSADEPLRLSMLGLSADSVAPGFADSINEMTAIGPSVVCIHVWFDGLLRTAPYSPAVQWLENYTSAGNKPTDWLKYFELSLYNKNIVPFIQCSGAPPQYAESTAVKPAEHPAPTDMLGYTQWTKSWLAADQHVQSAMFVVNNEPGHALYGFEITKDSKGNTILPNETKADFILRNRIGTEKAATIQAEMLYGVASGLGSTGRLGLGSYITVDNINANGHGMIDGERTFFEGAVDAYNSRTYAKKPTFIAYNNYNGRYESDIFARWISRNNNTLQLPALFTQYSPGRVKKAFEDPDGPDGKLTTMGAACDVLTDLGKVCSMRSDVRYFVPAHI